MDLRNRGMEAQGGSVFIDRAIGIAQLEQCSPQRESWLLGVRFGMQSLASLRQQLEQRQWSWRRNRRCRSG